MDGEHGDRAERIGDLERALEIEQWKVAWFLAGYSGLGRQYKEMKAQLVAVREAWEFVELAWTDSDVHPRHAPDECDSCDAFWAMLMVIRDAIDATPEEAREKEEKE
ncbi:hypothetical protein LCGC14_1461660 [marine sediment metagenome]|uniref:Uncharacterized protein n=1 Tax=marine sediment metagenome TaxID=412755 RepID=A0A0F9LVI7_9ZZZZ